LKFSLGVFKLNKEHKKVVEIVKETVLSDGKRNLKIYFLKKFEKNFNELRFATLWK
jgi:hypothetical protein